VVTQLYRYLSFVTFSAYQWQLKLELENRAIAMYCNLRASNASSPWITTPCQVWNCSVYPLPCYSVFTADTLRYVVTLTFNLWLWPFAVYLLCRWQTLYQIWMQSSNPRWSYCDFNICHNDLKHVSCVALGSGIIFTKFKLGQPNRSWLNPFYPLLISCVKLWPWPFDFEPWKTWEKNQDSQTRT